MSKSRAMLAFSVLGLGLAGPVRAQDTTGSDAAAQAQRERAQQEQAAAAEQARQEQALVAERAQQEAEVAALRAEAEQQAVQARTSQQAELERLRAELERARAELERAARNVAVSVVTPFEAGVPSAPGVPGVPGIVSLRLAAAQLGMVIVDADAGALVTQVTPGGGAETAGIRVGDIVQSIDGVDISDSESPHARLLAQLDEVEPGESVALVVQRGGNVLPFDVTAGPGGFGPLTVSALNTARDAYNRVIGNWPEPAVVVPRDGTSVFTAPGSNGQGLNIFRSMNLADSTWGEMELVPMTPELGRYFQTSEGLLVVRGPSDDSIDIQDGDVILAISGRTPNSPEHAIRILSSFEAGETIEFSVMRQGSRQTTTYQVPPAQANDVDVLNFQLQRQ